MIEAGTGGGEAAGEEAPRSVAGAPRATRLGVAALTAAAAVLFLAFRLPYLELPLERDEGEYAYVAQRLFDADFVPYRDAFVHKPPAVFLAYLTAFHTTGESTRGIRLFSILWMGITLVAVVLLGRRLLGPWGGAFAGLVFACLSSAPSLLGPSANTEMFLLLPLVASLSLALRAGESGRLLTWALAGAVGAAALWFKPLAAPHAAVLAGYAALGAPLSRAALPAWPRRCAWLAALAGGALAASAPIPLYFAAQGSLHAFLDAVFLYNAGYAGALTLAQGMAHLRGELAWQLPELFPIFLLAAAAFAGPLALPGRTRVLLGVWLAACFLGLSLGFYYRPHYFMVWVPPLCLLAGGAAARALVLAGSRTSWRSVVLVVLLVAVTAPLGRSHRLHAASCDAAAQSRLLYGQNPFAESAEIAEAIREITRPDDAVWIVGSEPQILFHAERRSATRYILTYPLLSGHPSNEERQREALAQVAEVQPAAVLLVRVPHSHLRHPQAPIRILRESMRIVEEEYELVAFWLATPGGFRKVDGEEALELERRIGATGARANLALFRRRGAEPLSGALSSQEAPAAPAVQSLRPSAGTAARSACV